MPKVLRHLVAAKRRFVFKFQKLKVTILKFKTNLNPQRPIGRDKKKTAKKLTLIRAKSRSIRVN